MSIGVIAAHSPIINSANYASEVMADAPYAWWRLTETSGQYLDSSGTGMHMDVTGGNLSRGDAGPKGKATYWVWDTTNAKTPATWPLSSTRVTLECWVWMDSTPGAITTLIGNGAINVNANSQTEFALQVLTTGAPRLYNYNGAARLLTAPALSLNTWHHVLGIMNPSGMTIRVDKVNVATLAQAWGGTGARPIWLHGGGYLSNGGQIHMAEPAIYQTDLSAARCDAHYDAAA